jgi:alcohol dehydrogenase class IV
MQQYNYPTTILYGHGSLDEFAKRLKDYKYGKSLIVTDSGIKDAGLLDLLTEKLDRAGAGYTVFHGVKPNPDEKDVEAGVEAYKNEGCDSLIALGGGSPIDTAKVIKIMAGNKPPLAQYDDCLGGDRLITGPMPPLYAIPTTAGTGSEVGRSGVIILTETGKKTIFFHPDLMPKIAVLEPEMTTGLPADLTAATGIDAFPTAWRHTLPRDFIPWLTGSPLRE